VYPRANGSTPDHAAIKIVIVQLRGEYDVWSDLRRTRHDPPGNAAHDLRRRAVYVAALQQAEDYYRAAGLVGPATSPLLQFYGLSQAGRAIAAAAVNTAGGDWELVGHGLKVESMTTDLPGIKVVARPKEEASSFVRVSRILGSPLWNGTTAPPLSQLWDNLPELVDRPLRESPDRRVPLPVSLYPPDKTMDGDLSMAMIQVYGLPAQLTSGNATGTDFDAFMASYPTAAGYRPVVDQLGHVQSRGTSGGKNYVLISLANSYDYSPDAYRARMRSALTPYPDRGYYLFPTVLPGEAPLHPVMAWWAILYALSMLVRYQPAEWANHSNIDISPYANSIECLLRHARVAVPDLVRAAIADVSR
jgi:YaaC-like Protein